MAWNSLNEIKIKSCMISRSVCVRYSVVRNWAKIIDELGQISHHKSLTEFCMIRSLYNIRWSELDQNRMISWFFGSFWSEIGQILYPGYLISQPVFFLKISYQFAGVRSDDATARSDARNVQHAHFHLRDVALRNRVGARPCKRRSSGENQIQWKLSQKILFLTPKAQ